MGQPITIRIEPSKGSAVYYDVQTDLDPSVAESLIVDTFQKWVRFALGRDALGGRHLRRPPGRYATSLRLIKRSNHFYEMFSDAPPLSRFDTYNIADLIENGRSRFSLRNRMLKNGTMIHGKNGLLYKRLYLRNLPDMKTPFYNKAVAPGTVKMTSSRSWRMKAPNLGTVKKRFNSTYNKGKFRTISEKSRGWLIPSMPAYHPADLLSKRLQRMLSQKERQEQGKTFRG